LLKDPVRHCARSDARARLSTAWHVETIVNQDDQAIVRQATKHATTILGNYMNYLNMDLSFK
jgi:hypothetical protein